MPIETDIDVLLSCYLADSDRSPHVSTGRRRGRSDVSPADVVIVEATGTEGAADTHTQLPAARDAVGGDDYVITCNFHEEVVTPTARAHQLSTHATAGIRLGISQDTKHKSNGGRKRPRNMTISTSPSCSDTLNGGSSGLGYHAGQEVRTSRISHGCGDIVPSITDNGDLASATRRGSTDGEHYGHVTHPAEVRLYTSMAETQPGDGSGREPYKKQKLMVDHDITCMDTSTYEYLATVSCDNGAYYPTRSNGSWYVPEKGARKPHSDCEHPLHSLSRCCEKMSHGSALKSLVDDMAAEVTGHSEKMYLEYIKSRWFDPRAGSCEVAGGTTHGRSTLTWHLPVTPCSADTLNTLKAKVNHTVMSVSGGTVIEHQRQDSLIDEDNDNGCGKRVENGLYGHSESSSELVGGTSFPAVVCGASSLGEGDETGNATYKAVQGSGPSREEVGAGHLPYSENQETSPPCYSAEYVRRVLNRRMYILDTEFPSRRRSGFSSQTHHSGYNSSERTNSPSLHHTTVSTNPSPFLQTIKATLRYPLREEQGTVTSIHSSAKDTQLLPSLQGCPKRCDAVHMNAIHQSDQLQSSRVSTEVEEECSTPTTTFIDSATGSTLSDFRALVEAFDSEESVSRQGEMVIDPVNGACQGTSATASKPGLSLHKPLPKSQQMIYTCSLCGRDNLSRKTVRRHKARNYDCPKCKKKFCLQELLVKHKKFKLCGLEDGTPMTDIAGV